MVTHILKNCLISLASPLSSGCAFISKVCVLPAQIDMNNMAQLSYYILMIIIAYSFIVPDWKLCWCSKPSALCHVPHFSNHQHGLRIHHVCLCSLSCLATTKQLASPTSEWGSWSKVAFENVKRNFSGIWQFYVVSTSERTCSRVPLYCQCLYRDRFKRAFMAATLFHI